MASAFSSAQATAVFGNEERGITFMYAAFLQELGAATGHAPLSELSARLVAIGDRWQEFAIACARMIKRRDPLNPPALAAQLRALAQEEQAFFQDLKRAAAAWRN